MGANDKRLRALITDVARGSARAPAPATTELFPGSLLAPHFEVEGRLGQGGAGVVYRARDRRTNAPVALKVLHLRDPEAIYWLKDEFRALADLVHPNINHLYELFQQGDDLWFFTMELVDGVPFSEYVADSPANPLRVDLGRLRSALVQLVDGVDAMHSVGKLHRDIKPSNVLVRADGHVVILDFGLVQDLSLLQATESPSILRDRVELICGTPGYMAPEQAAGVQASAASDWYAVGSLLYETLTGVLPYTGDPIQIMLEKQLRDPQPPSALQANIPRDLDELCVKLLARDARQRPDAAEIRQRLGVSTNAALGAISRTRSSSPTVLVGRDAELSALHAAAVSAARGATCVLVHGPSGVGKSTLLRHFIDELAQDAGVLVVSSRCFERESVSYKAIDGLVDRFARKITDLGPEAYLDLTAGDVSALLRVFPVLARCDQLRRRVEPVQGDVDPQETRRRAFAAFRQLARAFSTYASLVLYIDDLQWGDSESALLLLELLRAPAAPRLLLLGSYRTEEAESSPLLAALLPALRGGAVSYREIELSPLPDSPALQLATLLTGANDERARWIARESGGSPFFIEALAQHHKALDMRSADAAVSLDELVLAHAVTLPQEARLLLELVVVAGQPLVQSVALQAAQLGSGARSLSLLRTARLIRMRGQEQEPAIEPYHDRIREALHRTLAPERRRELHGALAGALEALHYSEPAALAWHWFRADYRDRALPYATNAAATAAATLAFSHAAELYALALECSPTVDTSLQRAHADALANTGRAAEAAEAYARAALSVSDLSKRDLQSRAAQQYLAAGHIDEGIRLLKPLMHEVGLHYPETSQDVLSTLLGRWQTFQARGTDLHREPMELPSEALARIDVARFATDELSHSDPMRAAAIMLQVTHEALDLAEPGRAAWALSRYGLFISAAGVPAAVFAGEGLFDRAEELASASGDALLLGSIYVNRARLSLNAQQLGIAMQRAERAAAYVSRHCVGGWRLIGVANNCILYSLFYTGQLRELTERAFLQQQRASELGDVYIRLTTHFYTAMVRLAADDPQGADLLLESADRLRKHASFLFQDWLLLQGAVLTNLYCGRIDEGWRRLERGWAHLEEAHLLGIAVVREFALRLSGNLAVMMALRSRAIGSDAAASYLACARDRATKLAVIGGALPRAAEQTISAGIALYEQRSEQAMLSLDSARSSYLEADLPLDAAAIASVQARFFGSEGDELSRLADFGIVAPERWLALHVPWALEPHANTNTP